MQSHAFYSQQRELLYGAYVYITAENNLVKITNIRSHDALLLSDEIYLGILPADSRYVSHTFDHKYPDNLRNLHQVAMKRIDNESNDQHEVKCLTGMMSNLSLENSHQGAAPYTEDIWSHMNIDTNLEIIQDPIKSPRAQMTDGPSYFF